MEKRKHLIILGLSCSAGQYLSTLWLKKFLLRFFFFFLQRELSAYTADSMIHADYADNLALLTNTPSQAV